MFNKKQPPQLRQMDISRDLSMIADLIALCFANTLDEDGNRFVRKMREAARSTSILGSVKMMGLPQNGFVWEESNDVVGNISIVTILFNNRPAYLIANVAVHPDYRRQGIARKLTEAALHFIELRRVSTVFLQVKENNTVAFKLYKNFGFEETNRRTTWHAFPDKSVDRSFAKDININQRNSSVWIQQKKWLSTIYPKSIAWHLPYKEHLLRPGFLTYLSRILGDQDIKQWAAYKNDKLVGTLSWQKSHSMADWLWLGIEPKEADLVISALLNHARAVSKLGRRLSVNYPASENVDAFIASGFKQHITLIWMKLDTKNV